MATHPLNFRNRAEAGKTRFAQTVPRPFSARLRKFKAPSRAGTSKAKPSRHNRSSSKHTQQAAANRSKQQEPLGHADQRFAFPLP